MIHTFQGDRAFFKASFYSSCRSIMCCPYIKILYTSLVQEKVFTLDSTLDSKSLPLKEYSGKKTFDQEEQE